MHAVRARIAGVRLRRPSLQATVTFSVVAAAVLFTLFQLQPSLLVANTTPSGGDTGAHVWAPWFMREHLLADFRLTGWAPDWYAGFPLFHFYFPLPALAIVVLDVVLPYGVAMKLVTVSGLLFMPVAAYLFGRLCNMRFPGPPVLAVATVPFLFDRGFTIYGGNIASTLAGEFTFSISLALSLVFLGLLARSLDTGRHRALAAVVLALTALCHLLPTIFAVVGAGVMLMLRPGRRRLWLVVSILGVGGLLAAFWSFPFLMRLQYANNMGWEKIEEYWKNLFPPGTRWVQWLALAGAVSAFVLRRRVGLFLVGMATIAGALFILTPEFRLWNARVLPFWYLSLYLLAGVAIADAGPELGRLLARDPEKPSPLAALVTPVVAAIAVWIVVGLPLKVLPPLPTPRWLILVVAAAAVAAAGYRLFTGLALAGVAAVTGVVSVVGYLAGRSLPLLPILKLSLFLLLAVAITEGVALATRRIGDDDPTGRWLNGGAPVAAAVISALVVALPLGLVQRSFERPTTTDSSFIPGWAQWNYKGYERKDAYPEYRALIQTMETVGRERGCGRAHWEYESGQDRFGTPMALMLLPFWTDGCIGSMEGLYFESSPTVPYHFLNSSELSKAPSNPQRELPYRGLDVAAGIEHLQLLGARYYMAFSPEVVAQADNHPDLTPIASGPNLPEVAGTPPRQWRIYEVAGAELVTPLEFAPAVIEGVDLGERGWMDVSVNWYMDRNAHDVLLAASGPKSWPRVRVSEVPPASASTTAPTVGSDVRISSPRRQPVTPANVSNIRSSDDSISFDVDRTGSPVLVKTSYFPPWKASGAEGPWRVTPNLMVVIPTDRHVELHYSWTPVDIFGWLLTVGGIVGAVTMARGEPMDLTPRPRRRRGGASDEIGVDGVVDGEADGEVDGDEGATVAGEPPMLPLPDGDEPAHPPPVRVRGDSGDEAD